MLYKTIVLELLQQEPALYDRLRSRRQLLTTMDTYARDLKDSHEDWKERIARQRPDSNSSHIASEAMELAIEDLQARLRCASPKDEAEPLPLDALMSHARHHTPPA